MFASDKKVCSHERRGRSRRIKVAGEDSVRDAQVWNDGGRNVVLPWRRGPQYVHEEGLSTFSCDGDVLSALRSSSEASFGVVVGGYGMNAWEPYCGSGSIAGVEALFIVLTEGCTFSIELGSSS